MVCVGAILKALINNNLNNEALSIYHQYKSLQDDITHVLAIKACINIKDFTMGQNIIDSHFMPHKNLALK